MSSDLYSIGVSGLLTQSRNLQTTSNNISNVNTPGYSRQRNEYFAREQGGVGRITTDRVTDMFARKLVLRDTSNAAFDEAYLQQASVIDRLLSENANSLSTSLTSFFNQLQESISNPTSEASRDLVLSELGGLNERAGTLSKLVLDQTETVNEQIRIYADDANSLIQDISTLNKTIASRSKTTGDGTDPLELLDQREEKIRQLSELISVNVVESESGESLVFTKTGEALVMKDGAFNVISADGNPVNQLNQVQLSIVAPGGKEIKAFPDNDRLGGKLGGLLNFRDEVLEPSQAKLGQIVMTLADQLNQQNKLGMDLDGQIGGDIFDFSQFSFSGYDYDFNTGTGDLGFDVNPGQSQNIVQEDMRVELQATGNPNEYNVNVYLLNPDGSYQNTDAAGNPVVNSTQTVTMAGPGTSVDFGPELGGTMTFDSAPADYADGDAYVLRPNKEAAAKAQLLNIRPEDLAYASPVRGSENANNLGGGEISGLQITNTDPATSAVNATSDGFDANAPERFTIDSYNSATGQYTVRVYDASNTDLGTFTTTSLDDVVNQGVTAGLFTDPGFEFSISGVPRTGDEFTIEYNQDGYTDNQNGLAFAELQNANVVRRSGQQAPGASNGKTFNAAYSDLVSLVGQKTARARADSEASANLLEQSTNWRDSVSGVNLDEEAANLIQYQQAYAAAARIITTAQQVFDTLLQSVR